MRRCVTSDEATPAQAPLAKPCADCPFARAALNGWLGGNTIQEWIAMAHGETHRVLVFATPMEFTAHHTKSPKP